MIGLVIVSHSEKLAEGVAELVREMAGPEVRLATAGGLDLPDRPLGTDAALVVRAIESVYDPSGVLVLMDLGSALLSAELALDLLPPEYRAHVLLCAAPLVEGATAAAVQARLGASLEQAADEARASLAVKINQLQPTSLSTEAPNLPEPDALHLKIAIHNRFGLHARPAARLVQTAGRFNALIQVRDLTSGRGPVSARSINALATLGVRQHDQIEISASGAEAAEALAALGALAATNFGDQDDQLAVRPATAPSISSVGVLQGIAASPGIAFSRAHRFRAAAQEIVSTPRADPQTEWDLLQSAIQKAREQIEAARSAIASRAHPSAAPIFEAHLLFLDDPALLDPAHHAIFEDKLSAAAGWSQATEAVTAQYQALDDPYLRARAADLGDVTQQVLLNLVGQAATPLTLPEPGILIATDLTPAQTAQLDPSRVLGIGTADGGPTSHSAILARALGIPAVVGLGPAILAVSDGTQLILDGERGQVMLEPDTETIRQATQRAEAAQIAAWETHAQRAEAALSQDGRRIEVAANIGSLADAQAAADAGADSVGLFRTEFLYLDRATAPDEETQYAAYRAAAEALAGRMLIIRTLDVGGDKPLAYLEQGHEANPFLGWRAIRLCLAQPDFFKVQLRAILRTALDYPVKIMFPMIATLTEFRAAKSLVDEAAAELQVRGLNPDPIEIGIMIEVPASAILAESFAAEVDFFSIGTNDLTQYTMAAERGNPRLTTLNDAFQPAVLRLLQRVVEAAHARGKWVGVCGELAGDALAVPLLIGLGIDELSMNAPAIPRVKQIIRALDTQQAAEMARAALRLETPEAIRAMF